VKNPRAFAASVLSKIETQDAYANVLLPKELAVSKLDQRDRNFVTELVYGSIRMRRSLDFATDRFLQKNPPSRLRTLLRLGAYQLLYMRVPPYAAIKETVDIASKEFTGVLNAVLRRVSTNPIEHWPDLATELSYPDWIVDRFHAEMSPEDAEAALRRMNEAPQVTTRDDGYTQDQSSTWVADLVDAQPTDIVLDVCAAPGGKATRLADSAQHVVASDLHPHRAKLIQENVVRLGKDNVSIIVVDATSHCFSGDMFDRVLVDAPCSGLGALRRRPDARWRILPTDIDKLVHVQQKILAVAKTLVKPGGVLVYSVCTITAAESIDHDDGSWQALPVADEWLPFGRGGRLLPHTADTDGMVILRWRRPL
jgi:16S rRNA (cytosine967-C5)-methyltransferase